MEINLGMRIMLCFLGIMVVALTVMGHVHVRSRRFVPIGPVQQVDYIGSLGVVNVLEIVMMLIGLRSLLLETQALHKCWSGVYLVFVIVFTILILLLFSYTLYSIIPRISTS